MLCLTVLLGPDVLLKRMEHRDRFSFMESLESEPELIFKLSNQSEFYCSACGDTIASVGNARFVTVGLADLIESFREHVKRVHPLASRF